MSTESTSIEAMTDSDFVAHLNACLTEDRYAWSQPEMKKRISVSYLVRSASVWGPIKDVLLGHGVWKIALAAIRSDAKIESDANDASGFDAAHPLWPIYRALVDNGLEVSDPSEIRLVVENVVRMLASLKQQWPDMLQAKDDAARAHAYASEIKHLRELTLLLASGEAVPVRNEEADETRVAWAFAHDDGSPDAGTMDAALRNLTERYGAAEAKRLESFVCASMLTGRLRDVGICIHIQDAKGFERGLSLERHDDGTWHPVARENVELGNGDTIRRVTIHSKDRP